MTNAHHDDLPEPVSGSLTEARRRELQSFSVGVLRSRLAVRKQADGCALAYPNSPEWRAKLEQFSAFYRQRNPDLSVTLEEDEGDDRLWLSIRGPEGTGQFVENSLSAADQKRGRRARSAGRRFRRATAFARRLPDFLVIGGARCGTTSLFMYLSEHPSFRSPEVKEIGFFDREWERGLGWYRSHFPLAAGPRGITGEATPEYLFHPRAAERAASVVPDARLIVLLRDPVDRAYSHYQLKVASGFETLSFEEALEAEEARIGAGLARMRAGERADDDCANFSYLARGRYAEQLSRWLEHFPRERLLVLSSEAFRRDRPGGFRRITEHLGLRPSTHEEFRSYHGVPRKELGRETRERLNAHFAEANDELYELLGEDFGWG